MMFRMLTALFLSGFVLTAQAADVDGLVTKESPYSATRTIDRLEQALTDNGITIVTRWSHSDRARDVDMALRPTELILFGNPKLGTQFFSSAQTAGIDLPLKALAWEDEEGQVWLGYNDPTYIAERHGINDRDETVGTMTGALDNLTDAAVAR